MTVSDIFASSLTVVVITLCLAVSATTAEPAEPTTNTTTFSGDVASRQLGPTTLRLIDVSLDALIAAGGSTVDPDVVSELQGGAHDPNRIGFSIQNIELALAGAVDPYFRADASIIFQIDAEGETVVELEEAYLTSLAMPGGLELKAGQFFTEFGRHNVQHPHRWAFVDQPVVASRLLGGDGLRSQGARLSWLATVPWYMELIGGLQNANGETVVSFLSTDELDGVGGYAHSGRETGQLRDLLFNSRWLNGFDVLDTVSINLGASAAAGPNAASSETHTWLMGADLFLKWQPTVNERGWPFVSLQAEFMHRWYDVPAIPAGPDILRDYGWYAQALWGFAPTWVAGMRYGSADSGNGDRSLALRDQRHRLSSSVTWYGTEYTKVRLQHNFDDSEVLGRANSVWVQLEGTIGAHAGHSF